MNAHQLTMTAGDDRTFVLGPFEDESGVAYNLAGATARLVVDGILEASADIDESEGSLTFTVASADTADYSHDHYYGHGYHGGRDAHRYEVELTLSSGSVKTVRRGLFVITGDLDDV